MQTRLQRKSNNLVNNLKWYHMNVPLKVLRKCTENGRNREDIFLNSYSTVIRNLFGKFNYFLVSTFPSSSDFLSSFILC